MNLSAETKVWKGEQLVKLTDLKPGDELYLNLTAELPGKPAQATDLWIDEAARKAANEAQLKKHPPVKK
jgi:hypothetical protein